MSFQRRIALLAGLAVAVAVVLASTLAYVTISRELRHQLDDSLRTRANQIATARRREAVGGADTVERTLRRQPGSLDVYGQIVNADGTVRSRGDSARLPVDDRARAVASGRRGAYFTDVRVGDDEVRLLVTPLPGGGGIQTGRSLAEVHATLDRLRLVLVLIAAAGIAAAALLGLVVARRATAPLLGLTRTAERIARTSDLSERIDVRGDDEIGRLAARFNEMLDTLDASLRAQRQLVADASHELRSPITSLRTNLETLQANPGLDGTDRARLLDRATAQTGELAALMNDLIDLARGDRPDEASEPVRLDELVEEAIERAVRHAPEQRFDVDLAETTVTGSSARLMRALNNLLDNSVTWNAPGAAIDVRLHDGALTIRDRGPGFDSAELEHVFDRFFRGATARDRSGSGLGLAIVRQIAESHGGTVDARNAPGGGAVLTLRLPVDG